MTRAQPPHRLPPSHTFCFTNHSTNPFENLEHRHNNAPYFTMHRSYPTRAQILLLAMTAALAPHAAASSSALDCARISASGNTYDLHSLPSPVVVLSEHATSSKVEQLRLELSLCSPLPLPHDQEHEARGPCPKGTRACLRVTEITDGVFGKSHNVSTAGHGEESVAWSAELGEAIKGTSISE